MQGINHAEQTALVIMAWSSFLRKLTFSFWTVSGCSLKELSESWDNPQFLDSLIYGHPMYRWIGCFPEGAFSMLPKKGFFSFQVILMDLLCAYNRSRGDLGEINTGAQLLPSSEGSLGSRCRSRKLGKCRTLLCLGLILTPMRGWIDDH